MIVEKDPPYMLKEAMDPLFNITYWYASPLGTFIWMYNTEKAQHVLLKFSMDKLVMQEVSYHISTGFSVRLYNKNKAPWPALSFVDWVV